MEADDRLQEVDFCFFNVLLNILFSFVVPLWMQLLSRHVMNKI